jgi:hypothetical protein
MGVAAAMSKPAFKWGLLVLEARAGRILALIRALEQLSAWHRAFSWPMKQTDYPKVVRRYLSEQIAPTGRPGRRRLSDWERVIARRAFENWKPLVAVLMKEPRTVKVHDRHGNRFDLSPRNRRKATPAAMTMKFLAIQWNCSDHAVRDRIYQRRKLKNTTKTM